MTKITEKTFINLLSCEYKAFLSLNEHRLSAFEKMEQEKESIHRNRAIKKLAGKYQEKEIAYSIPFLEIDRNKSLIFDVTITNDPLSTRVDALERFHASPRKNHFVPILFSFKEKLKKPDKLLLAYHGLLIGELQGKIPEYGRIVYGERCTNSRIALKASINTVKKVLRRFKDYTNDNTPPLRLNKHCAVCPFKDSCRAKAIKRDDLSGVCQESRHSESLI